MGQPSTTSHLVAADRLAALPKVELHVHLEGSIAASHAAALARRHGKDPAQVLELEAGAYPRRYDGFEHFLRTFLATAGQVRTPDDLFEVAAAFARDRAAQGIDYTETTFTAATHVTAGMPPAAMWAALREGLDASGRGRIGLIVDVVRDEGPAGAEATVRLVEDADAPIVGLGLSGTEGIRPEGEFTVLREAADRLGLGLTVHAGEFGTAANVAAAVRELGADRIGHGIAAGSDPDLLAELAGRQVVLEVCPSSNVALGLVPDLASHPLPRLRAARVPVVIGSDDPPFFATTLTEELTHAADLLGGPAGDAGGSAEDLLADLQLTAARASFAPAHVRDTLVEAIEAWRTQAPAPRR